MKGHPQATPEDLFQLVQEYKYFGTEVGFSIIHSQRLPRWTQRKYLCKGLGKTSKKINGKENDIVQKGGVSEKIKF